MSGNISRARLSGWAISSVVVSLIGFAFVTAPLIGIACGIAGIVTGANALLRTRHVLGRALAWAGIVIGAGALVTTGIILTMRLAG